MRIACLLLIFFSFLISAQAQGPESGPGSLLKAAMLRKMDSAVVFMENGNYGYADHLYREVLAGIGSIPSDLAFYFGKNSYYLGEFRQSLDWLTKYVELKGTVGQFSEEAVNLIRKAEEGVRSMRTQDESRVKVVLSNGFDLDCQGLAVVCPVCKGQRVIIKPGAFGATYQTCNWCDKHGHLTCEEYNLMRRGELKPRP